MTPASLPLATSASLGGCSRGGANRKRSDRGGLQRWI